jgi:hypothetical protein
MSSDRLDEVLAELSQERYYIVLAAYDAHELRRRGRQVLLWETRLSFNAEGKAFADRYPAMLTAAARHFGQNTPASLTRRFVALD